MRKLLRDLWLHLLRSRCIIRRAHRNSVYVGDLGKKGFRGVPLYQCPECHEFWLTDDGAKRLGGRP